MHSEHEKHEFALYVADLQTFFESSKQEETSVIKDRDILRRIHSVLRLYEGDTLVLFDKKSWARIRLGQFSHKKAVEFQLIECKQSVPLDLKVAFFLPLLKRDALEQALNFLTVLGATVVQLVQTEKTHVSWRGDKELERLERVCIAAAEQSKQFVLPELRGPITFDKVVTTLKAFEGPSFFFDPSGAPLITAIDALRTKKPESIALLVGPSGDLTEKEKEALADCGVQFSCLTPTILRTELACAVSLGAVRSLVG